MKFIIILVYLYQPTSAWKSSAKQIEYVMPSMAACQESIKNAKLSPSQHGNTTLFCAYKEVNK